MSASILKGVPVFAAALVLALSGCGAKKVPTGEVHGTVNFNGKPVTGGVMKFVPAAGGKEVDGTLNPDGTFRVSDIPFGNYKVSVDTTSFKHMTPPPPALAAQMKAVRPVYVKIPDKYEKADTSGLTCEVKAKQQEAWAIELK